MFFSATPSLVTAVVFTPVRVVSVAIAHRRDPARWLSLALSFDVAQLVFLSGLSSVWCHTSAAISVLLLWILQEEAEPWETPGSNNLDNSWEVAWVLACAHGNPLRMQAIAGVSLGHMAFTQW